MIPFVDDPDFTLYVGDAVEVLKSLSDESVHMCVTSPPYWGLRDYGTGAWEGGDPGCDHQGPPKASDRSGLKNDGRPAERIGQNDYERAATVPFRDTCGKCGATRVDRQLGLEATPDEYVAALVAVFREVRRVLRRDGTCWLNLGSSYNGAGYSNNANTGGASREQGGKQKHLIVPRGSDPSRSRPPERAPAYGSDGTAPPDSSAPGSACLGLCDGCLADFRNHRGRTADTTPLPSLDAPPLEPTGRGNAPQGSAPTSSDVAPPAVQESTPPGSSPPPPAVCWRCGIRPASAYLEARLTTAPESPASAHTSACTPDTAPLAPTSADRSEGTEPSALAWGDYTSTLKHKDMVPIPWMVAMALQADGWYLRSDIIWAKPNPMPESVTDRPTKAHEYLFLFSRSPRYFYDADAIREPGQDWASGGPGVGILETQHYGAGNGGNAGLSRLAQRYKDGEVSAGRNARSVWEIATQPYPEAHFATFPEELPRRCILAGCPEWVCGTCGKPRERIVEREQPPEPEHRQPANCGHDDYRPGVVLDPFLGSGTTALVARQHGRRSIGIELSPEYARLAAKRLGQQSLLADVQPSPDAINRAAST